MFFDINGLPALAIRSVAYVVDKPSGNGRLASPEEILCFGRRLTVEEFIAQFSDWDLPQLTDPFDAHSGFQNAAARLGKRPARRREGASDE
jgi:hypothetical protein